MPPRLVVDHWEFELDSIPCRGDSVARAPGARRARTQRHGTANGIAGGLLIAACAGDVVYRLDRMVGRTNGVAGVIGAAAGNSHKQGNSGHLCCETHSPDSIEVLQQGRRIRVGPKNRTAPRRRLTGESPTSTPRS